jgi:glycosyltransferase involved in cell wall biosynthesis
MGNDLSNNNVGTSKPGTEIMRASAGPELSADGRKGLGVLKYVLITPARNEAAFIEKTLKSMAEQTIPPVKWVIVSDGSTDGTDDIVEKYAAKHEWIELVRMPVRQERHFAGKVHAFNAGYMKAKDLKYDIIGNLDADISFGPDYLEFILSKFSLDPSLGVAGTAFIENSSVPYDFNIVNIEDVSGACQLFRRECFEEIGGYIPIKGGGIDSVAVYTARMKGWNSRTFPEKTFLHHRKRWGAHGSTCGAYFRSGKRDYDLGGHPIWEVFRSLYQMKNRPYIVSGLLLFSGYMWPFLRMVERPISAELHAFRRKEQMERLRLLLRKFFFPWRTSTPPDPPPVNSTDAER